MAVTKEMLDEIALSPAEYQLILDRLDREPNPVELGMFGALWSEHCGYKHSRPLLGLLPRRSSINWYSAGLRGIYPNNGTSNPVWRFHPTFLW